LKLILEEAQVTERKIFLRPILKRIEVDNGSVNVKFNLPMPPDRSGRELSAVLSIDTLGGLKGTVPELLFEKKELIPEIQELIISQLNNKTGRQPTLERI
jgi:hypothetical protein